MSIEYLFNEDNLIKNGSEKLATGLKMPLRQF